MSVLRLIVCLAIMASVAAQESSAALIVGGFGGSRTLGGNAYSIYQPGSGANTELTNPANAALYGDSIVLAPSTTTATPAYLSGLDIFVTGLLNFNSAALSPAEVTALVDFVNGGGLVIAYGDNTGFSQTVDGLLNAFGLDVVNTSNNASTTTINITNPTHPVMNGPFGSVAAHAISDSAHLTNPAAGPGELIGVYASGFGAIGVVNPGPGRLGGLVFFPDSETYGLAESNFRNLSDAREAFNNAIAWSSQLGSTAVVPEPASFVVCAVGALALLGHRLRRRKQNG